MLNFVFTNISLVYYSNITNACKYSGIGFDITVAATLLDQQYNVLPIPNYGNTLYSQSHGIPAVVSPAPQIPVVTAPAVLPQDFTTPVELYSGLLKNFVTACMSTVASAVNLGGCSVNGHRFITLSIHHCVQHDRRNAVQVSVVADTCMYKQAILVVSRCGMYC